MLFQNEFFTHDFKYQSKLIQVNNMQQITMYLPSCKERLLLYQRDVRRNTLLETVRHDEGFFT